MACVYGAATCVAAPDCSKGHVDAAINGATLDRVVSHCGRIRHDHGCYIANRLLARQIARIEKQYDPDAPRLRQHDRAASNRARAVRLNNQSTRPWERWDTGRVGKACCRTCQSPW